MILHLLLAASCLAADRKAAQREYLRGQLLERRGAYAQALEAYEAALRADPDSGYVNREAAGLALEVGDSAKALGYAKRAVELQPRDGASLVLLGRIQWIAGDSDGAQKSFEAALRLDPKSAESIYSLAGLFAEKNPDKARDLLRRFLEQNPGQAAEAHFQLAKIELQLGHSQAAQKHLREAIALNPDEESLGARYALAQSYEVEHSTDAALAEYIEMARIEPQNAALLDHIAEIYFGRDDWDSMRQYLLRAKAARDDDPTANHWLALDAEKATDWGKAAAYARASAALKDDPSLSLRLSYYLTQAGRVTEAVACLEAAHKRWPDNEQVLYFLALGYEDVKRSADAVRLLREVLALKPGLRDARYQLGVLLEKTGRMAEAEREFRVLLADRPDDASVLNYLGYSLADRGLKLNEAEAFVGKAVALDPGNGAYLDSLGWIHYKQDRSTQAVAELEKAVKALPEDETVWEHLGYAREKSGDIPRAWLAFKRSESLAASGAPLPGKAARLERQFAPEDLGGYYLDYLRLVQGGVKRLSGLCDVQGKIVGHAFSYQCLFVFRAPDEISLDLLGPLMVPLFRIKLTSQDFTMDPLKLAGVDPQAVTDSAYAAIALMRDYLSGRLYDSQPALYKKLWRSREVETKDWRLALDKASVRVENIIPLAASGYQLRLQDFGRTEGRLVARMLIVSGRGFELALRFDNVKITFHKP